MLEVRDDEGIDRAIEVLVRGFPERAPGFWRAGFERMRGLGGNWRADVPLAYLLPGEPRDVGVLLTPAVLRESRGAPPARIVNLSSWAIDEPHRWRGPAMLRAVLKRHEAVFTDLTPSTEVARMLPALGFEPICAGTTLHLLALDAAVPARGARMVDPDDPALRRALGPDADALAAHRAIGCRVGVLAAPDALVPLVFRPIRVRRLPAVELLYCTDHRLLVRHRAAVARWLTVNGIALMVTDLRPESGLVGHRPRRGGSGRFARGADVAGRFANRTDYLGSEIALFDF